jgi:hypothetical protein
MWDMFKGAAFGFLNGGLFANPRSAYARLGVGIVITTALFSASEKLGLPLPAAAASAAFVGGVLQPSLFKSLKYR